MEFLSFFEKIFQLSVIGFFGNLFQIGSFFQQWRRLSLKYRIGFAEHTVIPQTYYQIIIEIVNAGNHAIKPDAYYFPIRIHFSEDVQILRAEIVDSNPKILQASVPKVKGNTVEIDKLLLNPQDSIKVEIWLHDFDQTLSISSHITNVQNHSIFPFLDSRSSLENIWKTWWYKVRRQKNWGILAWFLGWILILLLLISIGLPLLRGSTIETIFGVILAEPIFYIIFTNDSWLSISPRHIIVLVLLILSSFLRRQSPLSSTKVNQGRYNMQPENIKLTDEYRLTNYEQSTSPSN